MFNLTFKLTGWVCSYLDTIIVRNDLNLTTFELIRGFFTYYADFNYKSNTICPFLGKIVPKNVLASRSHSTRFDQDLNIYARSIFMKNYQLHNFELNPMGIQDPIQLSNNVAVQVNSTNLLRFKNYCLESASKASWH